MPQSRLSERISLIGNIHYFNDGSEFDSQLITFVKPDEEDKYNQNIIKFH